MLYETHSHTPLCKHAKGEPEEYAEAALRRGLSGLIVTCHNPMPDGYASDMRMSLDEWGNYIELVDRARQACAGTIDIRLGLEADFFPGYESWLEEQITSADLHYVLGSVHPNFHEYKQRYWQSDSVDFQRLYFAMLADAAETRLFDCLSHPDIVKNDPELNWEPGAIMADVCHALDRIAETGIAMELNTSGAYKVSEEMNPFPEMLVEMRKREIPVVIGADAHRPERVGDGYEAALDLLKECGYTTVSFFLERERRDIDIDSARTSLSPFEA
jgi:histidinol-phosphatase (PHP family)